MAKHHRFSPSKLELLEACPRFYEAPVDENPDKDRMDAMDEGQLLHHAYETGDITGLPETEQREQVHRCLLYAQQVRESVSPDPKEWKIYKEKYLLSALTGGTPDEVIYHSDDSADVLDAKFGRTMVSPANVNLQGQSYAHLVFENNPNVKEVRVHFMVPRLNEISKGTYLREPHNWEIANRIQRVINLHNDPTAAPIPTEKACQWCSAKATCPALGQIGLGIVQKAQLPIPNPEYFTPGAPVTVEDRARAHVLAGLLSDWADQVKKNNALAIAEEGLTIPGFNYIVKAGGYKIDHAMELVRLAAAEFNLDLLDFAGAITTSVPKIVAVLKLHFPEVEAQELRQTVLNVGMGLVEERDSVRYLQRKRKLSPGELWESLQPQGELG